MTRPSLFRSGGILTLGIFLGRLAGFARELLIAHHLGGSRAADLAIFTLTLPDIFSNLLVAGAMGAALIPEFQGGSSGPSRPARALFVHSTILTLAAFGALAVLVVLAGPLLVRLLAPGIPADSVPELSRLVAGAAVVIPLTAAAAVSTAYLQSFNRFAMPSAGTLLYNGVLIGFLICCVRPDSVAWLAAAVAIAAAVRWFSQLGVCAAVPVSGDETAAARSRVDRSLIVRYVQALGSSALLLLVPVVGRALVSETGPGAFAAMNYVYKLTELPLGMVISVLAVVLLPRFSALFAEGKDPEALALARRGIWLTWIVSIPLALAGAWFREPLVRLIFGHGRMSAESVGFVADLTAWAMAALPAQGLAGLFFSLLSARKDTRRPFLVGLVALLAYLPAAWAGQRFLGPEGVVAAGTALHAGTALGYGWILVRRHGLDLLGEGLGRDLILGTLACGAGFAAVAAFWDRGAGPGGVVFAAGATAASFFPVLAFPRTRVAMKAFH